MFVTRKTIRTCSFVYGVFVIHLCKQSGRWKVVLDSLHEYMKNLPYKTARANGLPGDEHTMFQTCRTHQNWIKTLI